MSMAKIAGRGKGVGGKADILINMLSTPGAQIHSPNTNTKFLVYCETVLFK